MSASWREVVQLPRFLQAAGLGATPQHFGGSWFVQQEGRALRYGLGGTPNEDGTTETCRDGSVVGVGAPHTGLGPSPGDLRGNPMIPQPSRYSTHIANLSVSPATDPTLCGPWEAVDNWPPGISTAAWNFSAISYATAAHAGLLSVGPWPSMNLSGHATSFAWETIFDGTTWWGRLVYAQIRQQVYRCGGLSLGPSGGSPPSGHPIALQGAPDGLGDFVSAIPGVHGSPGKYYYRCPDGKVVWLTDAWADYLRANPDIVTTLCAPYNAYGGGIPGGSQAPNHSRVALQGIPEGVGALRTGLGPSPGDLTGNPMIPQPPRYSTHIANPQHQGHQGHQHSLHGMPEGGVGGPAYTHAYGRAPHAGSVGPQMYQCLDGTWVTNPKWCAARTIRRSLGEPGGLGASGIDNGDGTITCSDGSIIPDTQDCGGALDSGGNPVNGGGGGGGAPFVTNQVTDANGNITLSFSDGSSEVICKDGSSHGGSDTTACAGPGFINPGNNNGTPPPQPPPQGGGGGGVVTPPDNGGGGGGGATAAPATNFAPYIIGGAAIIGAGTIGYALWKRSKRRRGR